MGWAERLRRRLAQQWIDVAWAAFVALNLGGILLFQTWATVPFHFVWISLAILYGLRVWSVKATLWTLGAIVIFTGLALVYDVTQSTQQADELSEVPLMAAVFLAMLWHVRRGIRARAELLAVSNRNLELLAKERSFIQGASHVLRTPLTIALGHAEVLQRTTSDPTLARDAEVIIEELWRLQDISDQLLESAATNGAPLLDPDGVSLEDLVRLVHRRWGASAPNVTLGHIEDVWAQADPEALTLALDELIANALKHAGGGEIELSLRRRGRLAGIEVKDEGPGIPPSDTDRIFDRFVTLNGADREKGLGLGLALVRQTVEAHGGSISARSEVGRGAAFEISLPALPARVPGQDFADRRTEPSPSRR